MTSHYHVPEEVIAKAYKAYNDSPLPGQDAMARAIRSIKEELAGIIIGEYEVERILNEKNT